MMPDTLPRHRLPWPDVPPCVLAAALWLAALVGSVRVVEWLTRRWRWW